LSILIKNGRVIDPKSGRDELTDVLIVGDVIERIEKNIAETDADRVVDAAGFIVSPGLIDAHAHLREPGYEWKETIKTGTAAAAKGGFTSVLCMANTDPVNDNKSVTEYVMKKALTEGVIRVFPCGAMTKGLLGVDLSEMGEMHDAGVIAVSDDGKSVMNAGLLLKVMEYAKLFGMAVISHCEDQHLATGFVHEGSVSLLTGIDATPALAEEIIAARDIALARYVDSPIHITHMSSTGTVEVLREGKKRSGKVTGDTCPHYFSLTDEATLDYDTNAKVNPPLRSRSDVAAIKEGLRDDTIGIIATDHAPHDALSKDVEFNLAAFGISGFETALPLSLALVHEDILDLKTLLAKMTVNPARLLGLPYGALGVSKPADVIIFSDKMEWTVDSKAFVSKGKNTPFDGFKMKGKNLMTIVGGKIVYVDPEFDK
jgi:dihydroorotase